MKKDAMLSRRQLLQWTPPAISVVALPAHAQMTITSCMPVAPVLTVLAPPKCSGNPPVGTAVIEIMAATEQAVSITAVSVSSDDSKSDISSIPDTPFTVTETSGETITFIGPASDSTSCLPLANVTVTLEFNCDDTSLETPTDFMEYDITQLLIDSVP